MSTHPPSDTPETDDALVEVEPACTTSDLRRRSEADRIARHIAEARRDAATASVVLACVALAVGILGGALVAAGVDHLVDWMMR